MNPRTYEIGKKKITIADEKVLELIEKVENYKMHPITGGKKILRRLIEIIPANSKHYMSKVFAAMDLYETITDNFDKGKATSIMERYAIKHDSSARLTI